jgi:hypothetical protein
VWCGAGSRCGVGRGPGVVWDGVPVSCGTGFRFGVGLCVPFPKRL